MSPTKGWRACPEPGCANLTHGGRCAEHQRHTANPWQPFYESPQWRRMSARVRAEDGSCRCTGECGRGHPKPCASTRQLEVDHRVALSDGGPRLDRANLRLLCRTCHEGKTHRDRLRRQREGRPYVTPTT